MALGLELEVVPPRLPELPVELGSDMLPDVVDEPDMPEEDEEPLAPDEAPDPEDWAKAKLPMANAPTAPMMIAFMKISRFSGGMRTANGGRVFQAVVFFKPWGRRGLRPRAAFYRALMYVDLVRPEGPQLERHGVG